MKLFDRLLKPKTKVDDVEEEIAEVEITPVSVDEEIAELIEAVAENEYTEQSTIGAEELTENFLLGLLSRMDSDASVEISGNDSNTISVKLVGGKEPGRLIGRRGETLDAIQRLTNSVVNRRDTSDHYHIRIDAENYHQKREDQLRAQAKRTASRVLKLRRSITMEPMNAFERHVIHETLQNYGGVSTHSTGTEPRRCVVVSYGPGKGGGKYGTRQA